MKYILLPTLLLLLSLTNVIAQDDKTESPYFLIENELPENFEPGSFALIGSNVDVTISGVIAQVIVEQRYINTSQETLHSKYIFPGSSQAAIYAMEMQINDRTVIATIKERQQAQEEFEQAKSEGKSASLLQQQRPNVFQMDLANILPGDEIVVRFRYTENIVPRNKTYEFVFPTMVGPRYADAAMAAKDPWVSNPYVNEEHPNYQGQTPTFDLELTLNAGMPIEKAFWSSHQSAELKYDAADKLKTGIDNAMHKRKVGDMVFRYQLAGEAINDGLLLFEGEDENFFLYTMQPPARPAASSIPPRDYIFIVDVSGSMNGFPIEVSKSLMQSLLEGLRPQDRFNILLFAGSSATYSSSMVSASEYETSKAISFVNNQSGSGGTELLPALERALKMLDDGDRSATVIIATDGFVTVEREAIALIEDNLGKANFFPFGIGGSSNRYIIEAMAHAGLSEPFVCATRSEAVQKAKEFKEMIESPVLTNVTVDFKKLRAYDVLPKSIPDLFADRPLVIYGKYKSNPKGEIRVSGVNADGNFESTLSLDNTVAENENGALPHLWARQKVKMLADYHRTAPADKLKQEITALGLKYGIITEFTSFLAVDNQPRNESVRNRPSPPPRGNSGAVPEPHEWTLIIIGLALLLYLLYGRLTAQS